MGAWIEISIVLRFSCLVSVAPHMGAWIEIPYFEEMGLKNVSHPTWVRGLKCERSRRNRHILLSHPTWVRGLKLSLHFLKQIALMSHPTWVRGLK